MEEGNAQFGASHLPKQGRTGDNTVSVERHAQMTEAGGEEYLPFSQTFPCSRGWCCEHKPFHNACYHLFVRFDLCCTRKTVRCTVSASEKVLRAVEFRTHMNNIPNSPEFHDEEN